MLQDHANLAVFLFTLHRLDGDRSEEHRNSGTDTSQLLFDIVLLWQRRQPTATHAAQARVLAQTDNWRVNEARSVQYTYSQAGGEYLTGSAAVASAANSLRATSRSGGWQPSTHLSRYLIAMLWGPDPSLQKPSANVAPSFAFTRHKPRHENTYR